MSKAGNWVPLDKSLVKTLGTLNRPYSEVEAMFSHTVNLDCGRPWTYRGYAKVWQWSVGKVKRFIEGMMNTSGTVVGRKGNGSGTEVHFIDKGLWVLDEQKRNGSGTVDEHKLLPISNPNPKPNPKQKKKTVRFTPPSLSEVKTYCLERKNKIDPDYFIDFYESKGWMVGKNKMKDWKACIRTWEKKDNGKGKPNNGKSGGFTEARKSGETDWVGNHG